VFLTFFTELKAAGVPASLKEYLTLLEALDHGLADYSAEEFYFLSRAALVKDERNIDRFDRVFAHVFRGIGDPAGALAAEIPEEWLRKLTEKHLSEEEKQLVKALGGLEKILEELKKRLAEQKGRHQGGSKWVGTAGTSPFGAYGYNPAGVRIGQDKNRNNSAVKVWDRREFRDLDDTVELGTRNIKLALRRLRKFARQGAADELDLPGTIGSTARQGFLDVKLVPERRNAAKVLIFFDVGGSMDPHVRVSEELFSAARAAFKHLEFFYFHNCIYESLWKNNRRRHAERIDSWSVLHSYPHDYKVIFVGDASMSPFELTHPGGSVEHWNEEPGLTWLQRFAATYPKTVWLNPGPEKYWSHSPSISLVSRTLEGRMFPLTLDGIDRAMRELVR
jgi:uncharacterized protein with von Willebrand factor type A (vWA) domain